MVPKVCLFEFRSGRPPHDHLQQPTHANDTDQTLLRLILILQTANEEKED